MDNSSEKSTNSLMDDLPITNDSVSIRESIRREIADVLRPPAQGLDEITVQEYADMEELSRDTAYGRLMTAVNAGLMVKRKVKVNGRWLTAYRLMARTSEGKI